MRIFSVLVSLALAGCGSSNVAVPDAAVPLDMQVAAPARLGPAQTLTRCLAVDDSFVYWSDGTPAIMKLPIAGGTPTALVAGGDKNGCVAVDGSGVYYFEADKLMKAPLGGGSAAPLATGQHLVGGAPLVAAGGYVYFITDVYGNVDAYNGKNAIVRVSTTAAGAASVVSAEVVGAPAGLAVDDRNVYYSDQSGVFARALAAPTMVTSFGQSALHGNAIALGNGLLAMNEVSSVGAGDIAVFRSDGTMRVVVSMALARPLALDDRGAYVVEAGALERLALDGSGATLLATQAPRALALTATTIFFTDGSAIYSLPK